MFHKGCVYPAGQKCHDEDRCQFPARCVRTQRASSKPVLLPRKTYRSKLLVEALRWTDTAENRAQFAEWFDQHDVMFETRGPQVLLPDREDNVRALVSVGDWIVYAHDEFIAMSDPLFTTYEKVP